ncbi:hypothetical protein PsYK624_146550 [Phanerochaete sordida]|uniref:Uncharacterized protein n=1 Tax=Phanerochaete sordida TaxID=48140 RepID=A0A9P3LKK0_9APHY|nr:hypothetical protein PsYK624_146550 [Phanerochaete sordida]
MNAHISLNGAPPAHPHPNATIFTPQTWAEQLATGPQEMRTIDLELAPCSAASLEVLTSASWTNITALHELRVTLPYDAPDADAFLALARSVKTIIAALGARIGTVTLRNPLPASVLRYRAARDVAELMQRLRRVWYGVDRNLSMRCCDDKLVNVALVAAPGAPRISSDEQPRVREFFPALAQLQGVV